jgi:hypothetical protein
MLLLGWCMVQMVNEYKHTGTFLDLSLAFTLLHGFPTMLVLTTIVITSCAFLSVLFESVMLINVDIKKTEESKHLMKKAKLVDIIVCTAYAISILGFFTIPVIYSLQWDLSPGMLHEFKNSNR